MQHWHSSNEPTIVVGKVAQIERARRNIIAFVHRQLNKTNQAAAPLNSPWILIHLELSAIVICEDTPLVIVHHILDADWITFAVSACATEKQ